MAIDKRIYENTPSIVIVHSQCIAGLLHDRPRLVTSITGLMLNTQAAETIRNDLVTVTLDQGSYAIQRQGQAAPFASGALRHQGVVQVVPVKDDAFGQGQAINVTDAWKEDNLGDGIFHDPSKPNLAVFRDGLRLVREAAGPQTFILGCCAPQNIRSYAGVFGLPAIGRRTLRESRILLETGR